MTARFRTPLTNALPILQTTSRSNDKPRLSYYTGPRLRDQDSFFQSHSDSVSQSRYETPLSDGAGTSAAAFAGNGHRSDMELTRNLTCSQVVRHEELSPTMQTILNELFKQQKYRSLAKLRRNSIGRKRQGSPNVLEQFSFQSDSDSTYGLLQTGTVTGPYPNQLMQATTYDQPLNNLNRAEMIIGNTDQTISSTIVAMTTNSGQHTYSNAEIILRSTSQNASSSTEPMITNAGQNASSHIVTMIRNTSQNSSSSAGATAIDTRQTVPSSEDCAQRLPELGNAMSENSLPQFASHSLGERLLIKQEDADGSIIHYENDSENACAFSQASARTEENKKIYAEIDPNQSFRLLTAIRFSKRGMERVKSKLPQKYKDRLSKVRKSKIVRPCTVELVRMASITLNGYAKHTDADNLIIKPNKVIMSHVDSAVDILSEVETTNEHNKSKPTLTLSPDPSLKVPTSPTTPSSHAAALALLTSRISALQSELENAGKGREDNKKPSSDLVLESNKFSSKKEEKTSPILDSFKIKYSTEADIKKTDRLSNGHSDYYSDSNETPRSSDKSTVKDFPPISPSDTVFDSERLSRNTSAINSMYSVRSAHSRAPSYETSKNDFIQSPTFQLSAHRGRRNSDNDDLSGDERSAEIERLEREHRKYVQALKKEHGEELERIENEHSAEMERTLREYRDELERTENESMNTLERTINDHRDEMEQMKKELSEKFKEQEERIMMETARRHRAEKDELLRAHDEELSRIKSELERLTSLNELVGQENETLKQRLSEDQQALRAQLDNQSSIEDLKRKFEQERRALEDRLMNAIQQKEETEVSWSKYKRETENLLNEFKSQLESFTLVSNEKDALETENHRLRQEVGNLNAFKENAEDVLVKIKEEMGKSISELKSQLSEKADTESMLESLQIELNNSNSALSELQSQQVQNERKLRHAQEKCEDLQIDVADKKSTIENLERQLDRIKDEIERTKREHERSMDILRSELDVAHQKDLNNLREKLENEYEAARAKLTFEHDNAIMTLRRQNEELGKTIAENAVSVEALEAAAKRLEAAESSYQELNSNYYQSIKKSQDLTAEVASLRSQVEELGSTKDILEQDKKMKDAEIETLKNDLSQRQEENLALRADIKEVEATRNKFAGVIAAMKDEWEHSYQLLKNKFSEAEQQRDKLQARVIELENGSNSEIEQLKSSLSEKAREIEQATAKFQAAEKQKDILSKMLEEHQNGMQTIMKDMAADREQWTEKENEMALSLKEKDRILSEKLSLLEAARTDKEAMKQKLIEVGREKVSVDNRIRELEGEKKKIEEDMKKLESRLTDKTREYDRLKEQSAQWRESDKQKRLLEQEINEMKRGRGEKDLQISHLETEMDKKDAEIRQLDTLKKQLQAKIEGLEASQTRFNSKLRAAEADASTAMRNADSQVREMQNRLNNSQNEIEELHNQITELKQKLIEKEGFRSPPRSPHTREDVNVRLSTATQTIMSLEKQVEKLKAVQDMLNSENAALKKSLSESETSQHAIMQAFEQSISQTEKTVSTLRERLDTTQKECALEKERLIQTHKELTESLQQRYSEQMAELKNTLQSYEKRERDLSATGHDARDSADVKLLRLQAQITSFEKELKESKNECLKLNEALSQVQMSYLDAVNEKDQILKTKKDLEKKLKSQEDDMQQLMAKNMELVMQISMN
ncbi:10731_t:CDS:2 [Paraglomus occultum]|uniref:10731_t:CDS:1 n=1 Tax=Paraglomus occultum TaxID=144539 RepID=A0A9N9AYL3_9GLOM|nr:10731_t:CDS:2 [Paraglomus occultum]